MSLIVNASEKMDVLDHYIAWRQSHDHPQRRPGQDGPFSFCTYPFLLDARAKSKLLHMEAKLQMEQVGKIRLCILISYPFFAFLTLYTAVVTHFICILIVLGTNLECCIHSAVVHQHLMPCGMLFLPCILGCKPEAAQVFNIQGRVY